MLEDEEPDLDELAREQFEDALVDGDVPFQRGTAQAALRHRNFRIVYFGVFASNIGTWMQNVVLGAYAFKLTGSSAYVGLVYLRAARPAAVPLDARRRCSPTSSTGAGSSSPRSSRSSCSRSGWPASRSRATRRTTLIVVAVFAVGIANALGAPGLNAILPTLVPREDLPGRGRAGVGADEPLARHRSDHRCACIYCDAERGAGVRASTRSPTCSP